MISRGFVPVLGWCLSWSWAASAQMDAESTILPPTVPQATPPDEELPSVIDYVPGQSIPSGYVLRRRVRRGLVISGSIVFGLGYGLSVLGALPSERDKDIDRGWLFLPVLGPIVALATQRDTCEYAGSDAHCEKATSTVFVLATLFSMQTVGAGLFAWGIMDKRNVLELQTAHKLSIGPTRIGRSGYGLAATGEF